MSAGAEIVYELTNTPQESEPDLPAWQTDPESSLKELEADQSLSLEDIGNFLKSLTWLEADATCMRFNVINLQKSGLISIDTATEERAKECRKNLYDIATEKYGITVCAIASKLVSSLYNQISKIPTFSERVPVISRFFCFDDDDSYRLLRFLDMALRVSDRLHLNLEGRLDQQVGLIIANLIAALNDYQIQRHLEISLITKIKQTLSLTLQEQLISFFRETDVNVVKAYIYFKRLSFTASPGLQKVREWFSQLNTDFYTKRLTEIINMVIDSMGGVTYFDQDEIKNMLEEAAKNYGWLKQSDNTEAIIPQEPSGDYDYRIVW